MKILLLLSLFTLCISGILTAEDEPTKAPTTTPDTTSSTELPTSSSIAPTTTVAPTTTTTVVPTTTPTVPPTTTSTEAPTTVPTTLPPTTSEPSTSTKEPVTTLAPVTTTQVPGPDECGWNITSSGNFTCIRADFKISFVIPIEDQTYHINLGCKAKSELSDCSSNETQSLVLYEATYKLTMDFERADTKFTVKDIVFEYKLPAGEGVVANNETKIFSVNTGKSYLCKTKTPIKLGNVTMNIEQIHVQAFLQSGNEGYGKVEECEADSKVSDVVPIAVGVALALLIIIVLIAYLVGRRRSRQKGYQSV